MARKKLQRFQELNNLPNIIQYNQSDRKKELTKFLFNQNKIILELGCGKGEYSLALGKKFPDTRIIGIDIQGERLWFGAQRALEEKLNNIFFLRSQVEDLEKYFSPQSIDSLWLTFPDPFPKKGQIKKRLTSPRFLKIYQKILKSEGVIHLKTDNQQLWNYSIETINNFSGKIITKIADIHHKSHNNELLNILTYYEQKYLQNNQTIYYLAFKLR